MPVVIVAIPDAQDRVWKVSSEKVPHLTMMYLGDDVPAEKLQRIVLFVEHVANTVLERFGLTVDTRGELGEEKADVLFFEKKYYVKELKEVLGNLLTNRDIYEAYQSTTQFPEWIPHLTLGYPGAPAKEDPRDVYGITWVQFDRIAVWTGDYDGPEFRLKERDDMATEAAWSATRDAGAAAIDRALTAMQVVDTDADALQFGVKGMRWGVRRSDKQLEAARANADPDAVKAVETQAKIASAGTLNVVSSKDLQQLVDRIKLEQKYIDTTLAGSPTTQKGKGILRKVLDNEINYKLRKEDGPILSAFKAAKAAREGKLKEARDKAKEAAAAAAEAASRQRAAQRSANAFGKHPGPLQNPVTQAYQMGRTGPAARRTQRAQQVYNVTSLNSSASTVLALPPRKKP